MAPIFLCMTGQLVFNQIRFGNLLEYGARYQLDHISQVNVFNPRYIAPNAYNYLIRPVGLQASAPFLVEAELTRSSWPAWIHIPKGYVTREPVAGIFPTMPYSWFFLAAIVFCIFGIKDIKNRIKAQFDQNQFPNWIFILLAGGIIINFAIILCFQYAVFRYLSDVTPLLIIASSLGWWKLISFTKNHQEWCQFIILAGLLLAFISISLAVGLIYCPAVRW
jgi:hypothetical protein